MEGFQRNDTDQFARVQIEERSMWVKIGRLDKEKLGTEVEQGMAWLQAEKHPEVSLARNIEARLWTVQNGRLWSSDLTWRWWEP